MRALLGRWVVVALGAARPRAGDGRGVDATALVSRVVLTLSATTCFVPDDAVDGNGDGRPDTALGVPTGRGLCWRIGAHRQLAVVVPPRDALCCPQSPAPECDPP